MQHYQKYKELTKNNEIFTYSGPLNFHDVIHWKELIEKLLIQQNVENKQKRRIINILIEGLQNIQLHGEPDKAVLVGSVRTCLILLIKELDEYVLIFGNYIKKNERRGLEEKIVTLENLNQAALKQLYMQKIEKGEITEKGGAGLGLIKMFLESNKNTSYSFQSINDLHSFFTLELRVSKN